jgi:heat shock protein 90kDa beta
MVKRVFITSDLGEDAMPKWASWIKVVIDGLFLFYFINRAHQSLTNF